MKIQLFTLLVLVGLMACTSTDNKSTEATFNIDFEKFELDNGLSVVFHIDRSDPVVAVALTAHVGSAREKTERTGFAHLFEHLLFLESENLGKGGLDKMSARIGGSGANGSTSRDRTNYYQTVPKDALEKMIWAEADKLGWFINTVTEPVLAKEKQVVKNEKRQRVDNRPYGHTQYVIDKNLYPEGHPYNWQVIGSLEDLQNATLNDVKEFFEQWYVPNNTTLVVSGDFDVQQAKDWIHKYFDEIPAGDPITPLPKQAASLDQNVLLYHEDNFAKLPELTLAWPTVPLYHADAYALNVLTDYLAMGKSAPLYQVLVDEEALTSDLRMFNYASELAGQAHLVVRAYAEKDLDEVLAATRVALTRFEKEGISENDLNRIKAGLETQFYNGISSVLGKGFQLAQYNIFAGDPGYINQDIQNLLQVTSSDVVRVYETYFKGRNYVATSFVPKGQIALALEGSEMAEVVEEQVTLGTEETFDASVVASFEPTPSTFDRSQEPPYGDSLEVTLPEVWQDQLSNGLKVYGIVNDEVPLVQFNLIIKGGQLFENIAKTGVSNLLAEMLTKGTALKTPLELENAIQQLGASIQVRAQQEQLTISCTTLAKNYTQTLDLLQEILLQPRWDANEFKLAVQQVISRLQQEKGNPNAIAQNAYRELIYGKENIRSKNILGTETSVQTIVMEDLQSYYASYFSPSLTSMHLVGAIDPSAVMASLKNLETNWKAMEVTLPETPEPVPPAASKIYFYDIPDAKQSVVCIGYPALAATDEDFYEATVANYILGGGSFVSRLTQQLREAKGYTYGIRSWFEGSKARGPFIIASSVRSNVTLESAQLIKQILAEYDQTYSEKDLETTQNFLIKSNARAFETAAAKLQYLENISAYGWPHDYVKQREQIVKKMTVARIQALSKKYLDENKMYWLVAGDARTQLDRMTDLGFGAPVVIQVNELAQ